MGAPALAPAGAPRALGGLCFAASRPSCNGSPPLCTGAASPMRHRPHPPAPQRVPAPTGASPCTPAHPPCAPVVSWCTGSLPAASPRPGPSLADWVVLQTPVQALLEGDRLQLRCRGWKDTKVTQVQFFRGQEVLGRPSPQATLLLFPLQLHHGGRYRCRGTVHHIIAQEEESAPVTVVVQGDRLVRSTHPLGHSPTSPPGSMSLSRPPHLLPRALLGAGAEPGGSGRAPRGSPPGPALWQPPQPPAAPRQPPVPLLPG